MGSGGPLLPQANPNQLLPGSKQESLFHLELLIGAGDGDRAFLLDPQGHFPNVPIALSAQSGQSLSS